MKRKIVTAFMMAALGSSLVFSQAVMAADTTAKTETSEDADKDSTESEDKDVAEDADKADEEKEDLQVKLSQVLLLRMKKTKNIRIIS